MVVSDSAVTAGALVPQQTGYDLLALFRSVGRFAPQRGLLSSPVDRIEPEKPAELLDAKPSSVTASPLVVAAFVDGIQAAVSVAYRDHRPSYLVYTAGAAVDARYRPVGLREDLVLCCSSLDSEWAVSLGGGVPIEVLSGQSPVEIDREAMALLAGKRESAERELQVELVEQGVCPVVVDGSLIGRSGPDVVGVVKSMGHRYLSDESCLYGLLPGWRSPRFAIPAGVGGGSEVRYSAYVRLFDAGAAPWDFGLVRVESFDPELLDSVAAMCLSERQSGHSGDGRWDRHILGIRRCEEFMRSRRPAVFAR
jgi:hypothetical protein